MKNLIILFFAILLFSCEKQEVDVKSSISGTATVACENGGYVVDYMELDNKYALWGVINLNSNDKTTWLFSGTKRLITDQNWSEYHAVLKIENAIPDRDSRKVIITATVNN